MINRKDLLKFDDWDLTLKGLVGLRASKYLELIMLEGDILFCERMIESFPPIKKVDKIDVVKPEDCEPQPEPGEDKNPAL